MSVAIQTHLSPLWHTCGKREPAIYFMSPPLERMVESRYFYAGLCTNNLFPPNVLLLYCGGKCVTIKQLIFPFILVRSEMAINKSRRSLTRFDCGLHLGGGK